MSVSLWKSRFRCSVTDLATASHLGILRNPHVSFLRLFSSGGLELDQEHSFTVSYLIDSLGFSPKAALSASKSVTFETCEKPDRFISLLERYGFSRTNISTLVRTRPTLLVSDLEKTISPKLEFLKAKGVSWPEMAKRVSLFPTILHSSLDKQIIPAFEFCASVFHSKDDLVSAIQRYPDLLTLNVEKYCIPNVAILRQCGVPDCFIATLILKRPRALMVSSDKFGAIVEQVVEMGFCASRRSFVSAVSALRSMSKSTWESKVSQYKKLGWSDQEFLEAFERCPQCMTASLEKITASMDFYVNVMGLKPSDIVKYPLVLTLSLEKRVRPRHFVFAALLSKGLVKKEVSLALLYGESEEKFVRKFVVSYEKQVPGLMKLYKDKLGPSSGSETDNE